MDEPLTAAVSGVEAIWGLTSLAMTLLLIMAVGLVMLQVARSRGPGRDEPPPPSDAPSQDSERSAG